MAPSASLYWYLTFFLGWLDDVGYWCAVRRRFAIRITVMRGVGRDPI